VTKNHPRDPTSQPNFTLHRQWDKPLREEKDLWLASYLLSTSSLPRWHLAILLGSKYPLQPWLGTPRCLLPCLSTYMNQLGSPGNVAGITLSLVTTCLASCYNTSGVCILRVASNQHDGEPQLSKRPGLLF